MLSSLWTVSVSILSRSNAWALSAAPNRADDRHLREPMRSRVSEVATLAHAIRGADGHDVLHE
eukprot:2962215-Prymnesium_polylepis.2